MATHDEVLRDCVDACRAMRKAFRGLVRRNVESVCRAHKIEDPKQVADLVEQTIQKLNEL